MKHKHCYLILLIVATVTGAILRYWNLSSAVDLLGLFTPNHPSTLVLTAGSCLFVLLFLILSYLSPGRGGSHNVLTYDTGSTILGLTAGILMLLGVILNAVFTGLDVWNGILLILGVLSSVSLMILSKLRKSGNKTPVWELFPIVFLLVKLFIQFKDWSTDPVILDYCFQLLALIFSLLAVYGSAGFCFDRGAPRKTLFYSACGIFFSAMATADGLQGEQFYAYCFDLGMILWLVSVVLCLLKPQTAPPTEESLPDDVDLGL